MLNICVCDDSTEFIRAFTKQLRLMCNKYFSKEIQYTICGAFNSASDVINYIEDSTIDVLFLDIDMPEINGFDLAKHVSMINPEAMIVFVSGHDHFVFEVFKFSPFAYLRKTKVLEDLPEILKRIDEYIYRKNIRIDVETIYGQLSVPVKEVLYIESDRNYYTIITRTEDKIMCRGTLSSAEKSWREFDFYRVHSAYIVNLDHIQSVRKNELTIGTHNAVIPIAQRRLANFRKVYAAYTMRRFES